MVCQGSGVDKGVEFGALRSEMVFSMHERGGHCNEVGLFVGDAFDNETEKPALWSE